MAMDNSVGGKPVRHQGNWVSQWITWNNFNNAVLADWSLRHDRPRRQARPHGWDTKLTLPPLGESHQSGAASTLKLSFTTMETIFIGYSTPMYN
jgi:hypothetical protein